MSFKVRTAKTGHQLIVHADESVLDAARRQNIGFPYGCRNGTCATCKGRIIEGAVAHGSYSRSALSDEEKEAGFALLCRAQPLSDLVIDVREITGSADVPLRRMPCRVTKMERLAPDVMRISLKLPASERLQFLAGQYIDFIMKDGKRRSFSLANAPHEDQLLEIHVRWVPGGSFADYVFTQMKEKDILRIEGPFGNFYLREDSSRPIVFMAGGTGFAPIKSILTAVFAQAANTRALYLYWGARARPDLYLHELLDDWAQQQPLFNYIPVLSDPGTDSPWLGRRGYVHQAVLEDFPDLENLDVYASGPPAMVAAGRSEFLHHGLPVERYYYDAFEFSHAGAVV